MLGKAEERRWMKIEELQKHRRFPGSSSHLKEFFFSEFAFSPMTPPGAPTHCEIPK